MEEYYCIPCNYHTAKLSHFRNHFNTQRHRDNSNVTYDEPIDFKQFKVKLHCCENPGCDKVYTKLKSFLNHRKKCKKESEIEILKRQVKKLEKVIEKKDDEIKEVTKKKDDQLDKALDVARDNSKTAAYTTMRLLNYAKLYLNNAEPLEQLEDDEVYDVINYKNPKNTETVNETYVKNMIHKFSHNIFDNFVGDMIIEHFKPNKKSKDKESKESNQPKEPNVIATDTSRLCFIIMQKINKKGKTLEKEWINDKSGTRFTKLILEPMLTAIKRILTEFIEFKKSKELSETNLCLMAKCVELKRDIEVKKFTTLILRYVAPSFHFDQSKIAANEIDTNKSNKDDDGDDSVDEKPTKKYKIKSSKVKSK